MAAARGPELATTSRPDRCLGPTNAFVPFEKADVEQSIPDRFRQQVAAHPARVAVKSGKHTLTYADLNHAADRVARAVRGTDVQQVALLLDHDAPFIASILGVLKAGRTFVPLDRYYPRARTIHMLEDSGARLLLTDERNLEMARGLAGRTRQVMSVQDLGDDTRPDDGERRPSPDDIAYILYTSGSTGKPKGIMQNHRNVLHAALRLTNSFHLHKEDRLSFLFSCSYAAAYLDIFPALLNGASLFPFDVKERSLAELGSWLRTEGITLYTSVPSTFVHFMGTLTDEDRFRAVRLMRLAGEPCTKVHVDLYRRHFGDDCLFANTLACSETSIYRIFFANKSTVIPDGPVPVGYAVEDMEVILAGADGKPVGVNEPGEIMVRSRYLVPGYWGQAKRGASAFVVDPPHGDVRVFRTGDLGRLREDGCLDYYGRRDFQVKVRGHRVEVGEVEVSLTAYDGVKGAVVAGRPDRHGDQRLVAYLEVSREAVPTVRELRDHLKRRLPDYMVPAAFVFLEHFPLSANGKVDRQALPEPGEPPVERAITLPGNAVESRLVRIWEDVLGVEGLGITDDFFEMGGHSLLAVRLFTQVEREFGRRLPMASLLRASTVERMAELLGERHGARVWSSLVAIQPNGRKPPLFCVHAAGGHVLFYRDLAARLGPDQPVFGLQAQGLDGTGPRHTRIEAMAADYVREIRSVWPRGPYYLAGSSFGGLVAYEMAQQLTAQGDEVALLALFDAYGEGYPRYLPRTTWWHRAAYNLELRVRHHWGSLVMLPRDQRWPYVTAKLRQGARAIGNAVSRVRRGVARKACAALGRPLPDPGPLEAEQLRERYSIKPYRGRITLFRANVQPRGTYPDANLGWTGLAKAGLDVHEVPGNHGAIVVEPRVRFLVEKLKPYLA